MTDFEIRADGSMKISGYVNAVGRDSRPVMTPDGRVIEQIQPGAFAEALRTAPRVDVLLNHDTSRRIAGTDDGTAKLSEDSIGLRAEVIITDSEVISKARSGELRGWSFGFRPLSGGTELERRADKLPRRIVKHMTISEVSLIDSRYNPCYAGTSVECRAESGADEEYRAEQDEMRSVSKFTVEELQRRYKAAVLRSFEVSLYDGTEPYKTYEKRYNPYHDPSNGRFTSGGGGGGYLFVGKGEKGKGSYVFDSKNFKLAEVDIDCSKDESFVTSSKELLWESIHFPKNYKENLDHGDLGKNEYDELMSRVLTDVKENQVLNFQDSDGKSYTAKGTSFLYNGSKYGMIGRKENNFVVDHNSRRIFPIRHGYNSDFTKKSLSDNIISAIETRKFLDSLDKKSRKSI